MNHGDSCDSLQNEEHETCGADSCPRQSTQCRWGVDENIGKHIDSNAVVDVLK
jgi:hypothetical protein